ncbi:hypothetical protein QQZ08_001299 [Neonectria magnoliae]|uniref:NmrA-like domain-containing protein n=1 Tax=Neonectria magnoliae TaxID=2732573 RepID=A0ABR1IEL9_9HYPO
MVKIAVVGGSSELAREVLDALVATQRHEIIALVRKDPSGFPFLPGVKWLQTTYEDKSELIRLFEGVHTVLCFITVHSDLGNETQRRIIDAAVEAGVKRYAPSEWSTGVKLESSTDVMPWYIGKVEISHYLENLNKNKKVLEYTRFQPGSFMNYLGHPHRVSKYISTLPVQFDFDRLHALVVEGSLDDYITYTSVEDIANVVARAVDHEGVWPAIGGIRGSRVTIGELLQMGETIRGKPFTVDWLKLEDLESGVLKTNNYPRLNLPSIPEDQVEAFSKMATTGILIATGRGVWTVTDEWNQLLPDYEFTQVEQFIKKLWCCI